jgi:pimeloyl-ACP methyl ester carboxylesterase
MGYPNWRDQKVLAGHFQLELLTRPGYPPNPPEPVMGFDIDAKLVANHLGDGAHLVGHSYGGIVCLLAAALRPNAVLSLTVTEPPCFDVARGQAEVEDYMAASDQLYASDIQDPRQFILTFMEILGLPFQLQEPLSPVMQQLVEGLMIERGPWEAQIPLAELRAAPFPKLVVSGAMSHLALVAICDVLERELSAQRAILPDTDHRIMHSPDFNGVLEDFLTKAA